MAEHALDEAIRVGDFEAKRGCQTNDYLLVGAEGWTPTMFIRLIQHFWVWRTPIARNLSESYGTQAFEVAKYATITNKRWPVVGKRLVDEYPYIEAEVVYSIKEYACTAVDFLARRSRLAFLNAQAASEALPRVLDLMAKELNWSKSRKEQERKDEG